ncbi:NmrA-like protein [Macrophomina phaseolina MS6]|uniref:NmrA-like protein n=1 Tax=Macrophomina phaseolina (strain MS6) TaxID=1126212 RepID=K2RRR3_MACPH|nr:NmrA-like protein [Macrophomina phaseolina MS6]
MARTLTVIGATGVQGGSVVNVLLASKQWHIRAVTRNPESEAAKALVQKGVEVVKADVNDEDSLVDAFEGTTAIYSVTNFWEPIFSGALDLKAAADREEAQGMILARAAARTPTLEHYIWATLPHAFNLSGTRCYHMDCKAQVDQRIREELPDLAAKTTYLYCGLYPSTLTGVLMPFEASGTGGKHVWLVPAKRDASFPTSGDMNVTPGIWVRQILANPDKTKTKYAAIITDLLTFEEMLKQWSDVTKKPAVFVETPERAYAELWGEGIGKDISAQFVFGEMVPDWTAHVKDVFVTREELGIKPEEAQGFKHALRVVLGL